MEEIEQLWEETQREKNEIDHLKTKTEQQQEDIDRLTAEKHEQYLLIKRLRLQIENVIEKLEENKNGATREKMQLQKMWAEICKERETLERRRNEIISERHKLEMIKYDEIKSHKEPYKPMEQIKREQEIMERLMANRLLSLMKKNEKLMLEAKQAEEQIKKNMADIKQEFKINKKDISQYRDQIEHIKHNMNVNINKMKQRWTTTQSVPVVPAMESRDREKEGKDNFETVKIKVSRIQEEMEKLWDELEDSEQQLEVNLKEKQELKTEAVGMENTKSQKQRQDTDVSMEITQWEKEVKGDLQRQKQDRKNKLAQVQSERDKIERIQTKIQTERVSLESDRQLPKAEMDEMMVNTEDRFDEQWIRLQLVDRTKEIIQHEENQIEENNMETTIKNKVNSDMKRLILEVEEIRKMLCRVREDTEQSRRDITEEKSQIKWMNFRAKKQRQELDQRLEKTMKERDELEIVKLKIQQQREEVEQKLEDTITTILTMGEMKANIKKAAEEIKNTRKEMLKEQKKMEENKEEVKKYMVSTSFFLLANNKDSKQKSTGVSYPTNNGFQNLVFRCCPRMLNWT